MAVSIEKEMDVLSGSGFSCELVVNAKTPYTLRFQTDFCVYHLENGIHIKLGCPAEMESKQSDLSSWKSISLANSCESLNVNEILCDDDSDDLMSYSEDYDDTKLVSLDPYISMDNDPTETKETLCSAKVYQDYVESSGVEWLSDMSFYHHSSSKALSCDVSHDNKDSGNFLDIHNSFKSYEAYFMTEFHSNTSSTCDKFCSSLLSNKHIEINEIEETDNENQNKKRQCSVCTDDMLSFIKTPVTATENDEKVENDSLNYLKTGDDYTSSATSEENYGYGDYARCFFCGGGLRNWDRNDDPWIEHARWFPRCAFLRNNKGDKYVARIQRRHQEEEAGLRPSHQLPPPIEQDMDTVQAQTLQEMGYKNNDIQQAINEWRNRLRPGRRMPPPMTAAALMDILFEMEEKAKHEQRPGTDSDSERLFTVPENRVDENVNERLPRDNGYDDKEKREIQVLQEEFTGLNDTLLCKICRDKEVAAAFLPCGHLVCCLDCAPAMRRCPVCDEIIKGTVKTYFS